MPKDIRIGKDYIGSPLFLLLLVFILIDLETVWELLDLILIWLIFFIFQLFCIVFNDFILIFNFLFKWVILVFEIIN